MKRLTPFVVLALGAVVAIVFAVSASGTKKPAARAATPPQSAVSVKSTPLGNVLVDGSGRTLYLFQADKPNVSTLSPAGLNVWPAFTVRAKPQAGSGASAAGIGTITTAGRTQATYNGHPLYYYVGDHAPGDVNGQGLNQFGALWYVVGTNGAAVTSTASSSTGSSGAYGY